MFKERVIKEGPWEEGGGVDNMWMKMATCIRKVPPGILDCQGEVEAKLEIPGGGMMMSKRLLRRRNIVSGAYTWIGVRQLREVVDGEEGCKAGSE